jgi:hypothetical protein
MVVEYLEKDILSSKSYFILLSIVIWVFKNKTKKIGFKKIKKQKIIISFI